MSQCQCQDQGLNFSVYEKVFTSFRSVWFDKSNPYPLKSIVEFIYVLQLSCEVAVQQGREMSLWTAWQFVMTSGSPWRLKLSAGVSKQICYIFTSYPIFEDAGIQLRWPHCPFYIWTSSCSRPGNGQCAMYWDRDRHQTVYPYQPWKLWGDRGGWS